MRGAPPVRVACGPDRRWRAFEIALVGAAAASGCGWLVQRLGVPAAGVAALAAGVAMLGMRRWQKRGQQHHELTWSGRSWTLDGRAGRPQVRLDFGGWLLLRFCFDDSPAAAAWLPVDLRAAADVRHLLRTALCAQPPQPGPGPSVSVHG